MRRFLASTGEADWLKRCVNQFREEIGVPIPDYIPSPESFSTKLRALHDAQKEFAPTDAESSAIERVIARVEQVGLQYVSKAEGGLDSECVHEAEAQAEEEAEEEAEQEQEKMSAFARDDEQHNPWKISVLATVPSLRLGGEEPFYSFQDFHVRVEQPKLAFPPSMVLTDNFFKPRWVGVGDRRLKNVSIIVEWQPMAARDALTKEIGQQFQQLLAAGTPANQAAALAMQRAVQALDATPSALTPGATAASPVYHIAVSLAEGETLRRVIHSRQSVLKACSLTLYTVDGLQLDSSHLARHVPAPPEPRTEALLCLRFFNNEMFYQPEEVEVLLKAMASTPVPMRVKFYEECMRLRRRERNRWADTPLAKVLTEQSEWHLLGARAKLEQLNTALQASKRVSLLDTFARFTTEGSTSFLSRSEFQRCLESLQLGFAPKDLSEIVALVDHSTTDTITEQVVRDNFYVVDITDQVDTSEDVMEQDIWLCQNCTFVNPMSERSCAICEMGWTGERTCPSNKWVCTTCTFFNPDALFYCEVCGKVRSDLASVRL
jgi:hypothetical protein